MGQNGMDANIPNPRPLPHGFDPFNDRPSRTVRNRLSIKLQACIADREVFGDAPRDLVQQFPQPPYAAYIRNRVERYRTATREIRSVGGTPLTQAATLLRLGLYFEAHEILEPHWLAAEGREREGLKGLIQAIGVDVHREAGHAAAAQKLACKAVERLHRFGDAISDQQAIDIEQLETRLTLLIDTKRHEET
jgi:hypothetical protein